MLLRAGRPADAEQKLRRTIEIEAHMSDGEGVSPTSLGVYSEVMYELGRMKEAENYADRGYQHGLELGDGVAIRKGLLQRARVYRFQNDLDRSGKVLSELERRLRNSLSPNHIYFGYLASELAQNAQARGDLVRARQFADKAVAIADAWRNEAHGSAWYEGKFLLARSAILVESSQPDEALTDATRAIDFFQQVSIPGNLSSDIGRAYLAQGRAFLAQGKRNEAMASFRLAVNHLQDALGAENVETRVAQKCVRDTSSVQAAQ
jgi:tetratricopeptide (TPR) repeat protein